MNPYTQPRERFCNSFREAHSLGVWGNRKDPSGGLSRRGKTYVWAVVPVTGGLKCRKTSDRARRATIVKSPPIPRGVSRLRFAGFSFFRLRELLNIGYFYLSANLDALSARLRGGCCVSKGTDGPRLGLFLFFLRGIFEYRDVLCKNILIIITCEKVDWCGN